MPGLKTGPITEKPRAHQFYLALLIKVPTFSKEDIKTANRYMKRCSASLTIREMQTKNKIAHHLTPARMATIKKTTNSKYW